MKLEDINNTKWKPNKSKCDYCKYTDQLCMSYYNSDNDLDKEFFLNLILKRTVDGYGLIKVLEHNGCICSDVKRIRNINNYVFEKYVLEDEQNEIKSFNKDTEFDVLMLSSRWCEECGNRKPNITK